MSSGKESREEDKEGQKKSIEEGNGTQLI